eukprot:m.74540 g.74540  ORF g.74540 m.74540 type:complete len:204 (-) comp50344_c0_seq8:360-971(-)
MDPPSELRFKVVMLGDAGVGKSCFLQRGALAIFQSEPSTLVSYFFVKKLTIGSASLRADCWDTSGQERFRPGMAPIYYRHAKVAILVYDVNRPQSFERLIQRHRSELGLCPPDCIVLLVAAQADEATEKYAVPTSAGQAFADSLGIDFIETSARTNRNIEEAFVILGRRVLEQLALGPRPLPPPTARDNDEEATSSSRWCSIS